MSLKKSYIKPEIIRFDIDNTISLVMMTDIPPNPPPRGRSGGSKKGLKKGFGDDDPSFKSPFGDKPFE
jgi:hypothetical protein